MGHACPNPKVNKKPLKTNFWDKLIVLLWRLASHWLGVAIQSEVEHVCEKLQCEVKEQQQQLWLASWSAPQNKS